MKNKMTRNVILMAVVTVIMAVALSLYIQNTGTVPAADKTVFFVILGFDPGIPASA